MRRFILLLHGLQVLNTELIHLSLQIRVLSYLLVQDLYLGVQLFDQA
jgi:hypothetical protein